MARRIVVQTRHSPRQRQFAFLDRQEERTRRFKFGIVTITCVLAVMLIWGTQTGRYHAHRLATHGRWQLGRLVGMKPDRDEVAADSQRRRYREIALARNAYVGVYRDANPRMRRLLDTLGMDPAHAVVRSGNYHLTLLLPSTLYQADERRSYRLLPHTRSIWIWGIWLHGGPMKFFQAPDIPGLAKLVEGTGGTIIPSSIQTTNSWGCRGPEPDPSAPVRGLVLGDSNMQGFLIGDDETPSEFLRAELEKSLETRVSILNTGHLGYSPEQYFYSLQEYVDQFKPHFVVLSFCSNDFGNGDWEEGAYWFDKIYQACRTRDILCVTIPVPSQSQITGSCATDDFITPVRRASHPSIYHYCNPIDDLVDEDLRIQNTGWRIGKPVIKSRLYNSHIYDHHFSSQGAAVWARTLARRLTLLLEHKTAQEDYSRRKMRPRSQTVLSQE